MLYRAYYNIIYKYFIKYFYFIAININILKHYKNFK